MTRLVHLAVDAMGGDLGPRINVAGSLLALAADPSLRITLVGDLSLLRDLLSIHHLSREYAERLALHDCSDVVRMDELPAAALRHKKDSSMHRAIQLLASAEVDACVSSGNTGALMAIGRHFLGMLPGIERPALCTALPTRKGHCYLLDLGANVDCQPEHLLQFALMGSIMATTLDQCSAPRVSLLNIGHEIIKGNQQVKRAAELLAAETELNYQGFIEADRIFDGQTDVVVCDGFVGNIALKTSEGLAKLLTARIQQHLSSSLYHRLLGLMARPLFYQLKQQMDPARYNGSSFLGLNGSLVKSHGNADARAFSWALLRAAAEVRLGLPGQLRERLGTLTHLASP